MEGTELNWTKSEQIQNCENWMKLVKCTKLNRISQSYPRRKNYKIRQNQTKHKIVQNLTRLNKIK